MDFRCLKHFIFSVILGLVYDFIILALEETDNMCVREDLHSLLKHKIGSVWSVIFIVYSKEILCIGMHSNEGVYLHLFSLHHSSKIFLLCFLML